MMIHVKRMLTTIACFLLVGSILGQNNNCSRKVDFGSAEICLPLLNGYVECYQDTAVMTLADATEVEANQVLGFYLNNATHSEKERLDEITFDDYFKVYGTKQLMDYDADKTILAEMQKAVSSNFISQNWEEMKKELDTEDLNIEIGAPTLIDQYRLTDEVFTMALLANYSRDDGASFTMAMTISGLLINKRIVWMAYYRAFEDESTIEALRETSDLIVQELLKVNSN